MATRKVNCCNCEKKGLSRDEIGLNKKLIDKDIKHFYCLACMAEYFDVTQDDLLAKIEEFKEEGCKLF